jgi:hypothetical protein
MRDFLLPTIEEVLEQQCDEAVVGRARGGDLWAKERWRPDNGPEEEGSPRSRAIG